MPQTKLSILKTFMATGDFRSALHLAAGWADLGTHKDAIQRGWSAFLSPSFYREIGKDPEALIAAGIAAIKERYQI